MNRFSPFQKKYRWSFVFLFFLLGGCTLWAVWPEIPPDSEVLFSCGKAKNKAFHPEKIQVLVWNLFKGKRQEWSQDFETLLSEQSLGIFQEAYLSEKMLHALEAQKDWGWEMAISFRYPFSKRATGVLTGSTVRPQKKEFRRSLHRELSATPKMLLATWYPLENTTETLLVLNMHTLNIKGFSAFKKHLNQLDSFLKEHQGPLILAGDFNTWSQKRLNFLNEKIENYQLKAITFEPDLRKKVFGHPLDHAFIRGLTQVRSQVYSFKSSDHQAFSFELRQEKTPQTENTVK
jgi:endonuclease/exonuclease/phosphatase (EEP) superfamily protein YafD